MTTETAPLTGAIKPPDLVREKTQAQYHFTPSEMADLGRKLAGCASDADRIQQELDSIRLDYKNKLAAVELQSGALCQKIRDGYEMRETAAVVLFNNPSQGRKSYFREADQIPGEEIAFGEFIKEEAMSAADWQLPMFRNKDGKDALAVAPLDGIANADVIPETAEDRAKNKQGAGFVNDTDGDGTRADLEQKADTSPAATPLGDALDQAAAATPLPKILIPELDEKDWQGSGLMKAFRKAAVSAGWPELHISTIKDLLFQAETVSGMKDVLRPHLINPADEAAQAMIKLAKDDYPDPEKLRAHFDELAKAWPGHYTEPNGFEKFTADIRQCIDAERVAGGVSETQS